MWSCCSVCVLVGSWYFCAFFGGYGSTACFVVCLLKYRFGPNSKNSTLRGTNDVAACAKVYYFGTGPETDIS